MRIRLSFMLAALAALALWAAPQSAKAFETGGDMSEVTWEQTSQGVTFCDPSGVPIDPIAYAKAEHWTCIRLRLLVDGGPGVLEQNYSYDLALAKRIKASGLHLILDLFYSNWWADPGEQYTPSEWANLDYDDLRFVVFAYTAAVVGAFRLNGCAPDYVQVGNEISDGMLWPVGSLSNQSQFVGLVQAGCAGVRLASPKTKIILHCNNGQNTGLVEWFYNTIASQCDYDIVGLSYYPGIGTNQGDMQWAMGQYQGMFKNRPIMIVETGYNYDAWPQFFGNGYWTTPTGQQQYIWNLVQLMKSYSNGAGVMYWGCTYVSGSWGWESLFDTNGDVTGWPSVTAEPGWGSLWQ